MQHHRPPPTSAGTGQRFHVLCVAPRGVRLFEGDADHLRQLPLHNVPDSVDDVLATASTGPDFVDDHGRRDARAEQPYAPAGRVGVERFFRLVDEAVWDHYSRHDHLPVLVVADVQYLSDFLAISKNEYVLNQGIQLNPHAATPDRLRAEAMSVLSGRA